MIWKRLPHQFVLALVFGVIALGVGVAIVSGAIAAIARAESAIAYATGELQGIRYLARTHAVLRELIAFRTDLVAAGNVDGALLPARSTLGVRRRAAVAASIAAIRDRPPIQSSLDDSIAEQLGVLEQRWSSASSRTGLSPRAISVVIATIPPLLAGISGASGISNDPSIDGINFGDAVIRFPPSLAFGSEAATLAAENLAANNAAFRDRVSAARLLARAQTAIDVGLQDAEDERSVNPDAAASFERQAAAAGRAFDTLKLRVTNRYVESAERPTSARQDRVLLADVKAFAGSSSVVIDALTQGLERLVNARIDEARRERRRLVLGMAGAVVLELAMMVTLAWISAVSYQNQRKRMAAERASLESQRTELELQLAQAKAQQELLRAKAQFRAVFERAPIGMIVLDGQGEIHDLNAAAAAMLENPERPIRAANVIADHAQAIEDVFTGTTATYARECNYEDQEQRSRWFHVSISLVNDESGTAPLAILMIRDITASKVMQTQLVFDAEHDALTGLPNRTYFLVMLQRALDAREREASADVFSVVFIDFNDFKTINDSFGHAAGDRFLTDAAGRLRSSVRSTDVVARIGGDEFAILLHGSDRSDIEKHVARLQSVVSAPVDIAGQFVSSSASFGIAQAELNYHLAADIIRDADTAMYQAKERGGRHFVVFDDTMRDKVVRRMQLSIDLVHALEHNELELLYQPIVDLRDATIAGCEALVRWRRADGSLVSPTEFLPLAEENGSIVEIGRWVTRTACEQLREWNDFSREGCLPGVRDDFVVHINLAVPEVHQIDLLANLKAVLLDTGVGRSQVILEITEGIVLKHTDQTRATFDALTSEGFRLCIDDFGTGYSSLRYINELPIHGFKIDRSFVSNGGDGLANESIVEMLMVLSRSLDLDVVAEGIETAAQWARLRDVGCRYGQGYLFARPLDARTLTSLLQTGLPLATRLEWSTPPAAVA